MPSHAGARPNSRSVRENDIALSIGDHDMVMRRMFMKLVAILHAHVAHPL